MKLACENQIAFRECMNGKDSYIFLTNHVKCILESLDGQMV